MMHDELEIAVRKIKTAPLVELDTIISQCGAGDRIDISRAISDDAQRLARIAGYLVAREGNDAGHAAGVKKANTVVAALRRALGYTYPRQDLNF